MSATNVACAGKRGNICVGNNVSSFAKALRASKNANVKIEEMEVIYCGAFLFPEILTLDCFCRPSAVKTNGRTTEKVL